MTSTTKRKYKRIESLNLVSYECLDENNQLECRGMGRTLNVSESGIMLETHIPIALQSIVSLGIGLEDDILKIQGKIVHSEPGANNKFESGIEFIEADGKALQFLKRYIKAVM